MRITKTFIAVALFLVLAAMGCSAGGQKTPLAPNAIQPDTTQGVSVNQPAARHGNPESHLWGYYDVYVDIPSKTATAVADRNAMFAANVVGMLNGNPANLQFKVNGTQVDPAGKYVDVDIDVTIKHPFAGMSQYNGYDVRGIFLGSGSQTLKYQAPDLMYAASGAEDQVMYDYNMISDDPHAGLAGMPDGYTRWWNPTEFATPGLFGSTRGIFSSVGYIPSATLNPYKYFADDLGAGDDLPTFLNETANHGVFSAGSANTRNYYLRFPMPTPGVKFGYAIVADWSDDESAENPANAPEATAVSVNVTPDVYYTNSTFNGGKLVLDIDVYGWSSQPSTITIESTVLSKPFHMAGSLMNPVGGGSTFSTYHAEIDADHVTGIDGNEFWVIAEYPAFNYSNKFGVSNETGADKLAAFFRNDLTVSDHPLNVPPIVKGIEDNIVGNGHYKSPVTMSDSAVTYTALVHDPDPDQTLTITWYITKNGAIATLTDKVSMPVNWSLYSPAAYDIYVDASDGQATTWGGPYPIIRDTPPVVTGIEDNIIGNGHYKSPVTMTDTAVTYTALFSDPDSGQTYTFLWSIAKHGEMANPSNVVTMPVNWSLYTPGYYDIYVTVSDGLSSGSGGPYLITRNTPPVVNGIEDNILGGGHYKSPVAITDTAVTYDALYTDPDPGQTYTFSWWIATHGESPNSSNEVTMPIDWALYATGVYDIYVAVSDGISITNAGPYLITRNTLPVINGIQDNIVGGGDYKDPVGSTDTAVIYSALAVDPDPGQALTYKWWITHDGSTPGTCDVVTMPVNWSLYASGKYDIYVDASDGMATVQAGPFDITRNTPPVVDSGVTGETSTKATATDRYTVVAHDPDPGTTLTYAWTVTDVATGTKKLSNNPGNGNGTIDINWTGIGCVFGKKYYMDCTVSDGVATVSATTLTVSLNVLYEYDATTQGAGDLTVLESKDSSRTWYYKSASQAWDESNNGSNYPTAYVSILATPTMNLPTGYTNIHLQVSHWGTTEYQHDAAFIGYTTNSGSSYVLNGPSPGSTFLTFSSGTNFNSTTTWTHPTTLYQWTWNASWMRNYPLTGWTNKYFMGGYGGGSSWGSSSTPVTSNWTCNSLAGTNNFRFAFDFYSDASNVTTGWSIRTVKVYVDIP